MSFGTDGKILAASTDQGTVRLWDLGRVPEVLAFSPDGMTLAVGGGAEPGSDLVGPAWLFDVADPAHPRQYGPPLKAAAEAVVLVAFSPDNRLLAIPSDNGVQLWSVTDPARPVILTTISGPAGVVSSVAFSDGGTVLAAVSQDLSLASQIASASECALGSSSTK
jgi:WD40 repeat protein